MSDRSPKVKSVEPVRCRASAGQATVVIKARKFLLESQGSMEERPRRHALVSIDNRDNKWLSVVQKVTTAGGYLSEVYDSRTVGRPCVL
jgi:hypothetical protein